MIFYPFFYRQPVAATNLPMTLISLEDWALVTIIGTDSAKYLQGQVTVDVNQLTEHQYMFAAHCNPSGKMWSNFYLFRRPNGFALIERRSILDIQLTELKKYAIFSKVTITADDNYILLGVAGFQSRTALKKIFSTLPDASSPLVNNDKTSLLWFNYLVECFMLVTDKATAEYIIENMHKEVQMNNSQQWLVLNIEAGIPIIDAVNSGKFIPQATNMQALNGISFKKGCYIGQEMIARAKFRGTNKRSLWYLSGKSSSVPKAGTYLQMKMGEYWRHVGTVLAAVAINDGRLLVQAVMNKDVTADDIFRVCNDNNTLSVKPLPYSLSI